MEQQWKMNLLCPPKGKVDVVLDTDAFNEVDDQFAIAYLLRSADKLNTKAIYAAPFFNHRSTGPADGMRKSYDEIFHILDLCCAEDMKSHVYIGSEAFLADENTPVISPAAEDLAARAMEYTPEDPLYVVAIGAITNVASALLINPQIRNRIVAVWLGGHAHHWENTLEFNLRQDIPAARVVMGSGAPLVQLPCHGVVSEFRTTMPELQHLLVGKNPLADYLARNTMAYFRDKPADYPWSKVIWDVTAVAWLLNTEGQFLRCRTEQVRLPGMNGIYEPPISIPMCYVYGLFRDNLMEDLVRKLLSE